MISAIAAVDNNYGIGYKGELLCHIKEDLERFKELTTNNIVVMGRKTWDSLPIKPLPNRVNIVITNSVDGAEFDKENYTVFMNLNQLKNTINMLGKMYNIYIIGGGQIYKELLPYCEYIHLTNIQKSFENVDTYFPKIEINEWELLDTEYKETDELSYRFEIYKRKEKRSGQIYNIYN